MKNPLRIRRFSARIIDCVQDNQSGFGMSKSDFQIFDFSKSKIFLTKRQLSSSIYTLNFASQMEEYRFVTHCLIKDWTNYTLEEQYNSDDEKQFKIFFKDNAGDTNCSSFLEMNWWNKVKCKCIHGRYWFQREIEWFYKTIISVIISLLIGGIIGGIVGKGIGYNQGYHKAKEEKKLPIQDTNQLK